MASYLKRKSTKHFHLFNCDETCSFDQVKSLLRAVEGKVDFKIKVVEQQFSGYQISTMVEETIPQLKMDYAVFMVHANDFLSFNEDSNYGKLYKAIKQGSGEKVLVVIGGDKNYKDKDDEENNFISRSLNRTISTQFQKKFLDGRESFVFSWDKKHKPIHEDAILHFFDPSKKGQKFVYQPTLLMKNITVTLDAPVTPADVSEERRPRDDIEYNPQPTVDGEQESTTQAFTEGSPTTYSSGTVLLATRMLSGVISYRSEDVTIRKDDRPWQLSVDAAARLENEWKSTPFAWFELVAENGVVKSKVKEFTFVDHVRNQCSIS